MLRLRVRGHQNRPQGRSSDRSLRVEARRLGKRQMCFFLTRKGGKRKGSCHRERERPYIRGPAYFHSHATRIMRMGISLLVYRRTGFLTSSLFPRLRNRRVERFVKGGDGKTRRPEIFPPYNESASTLDRADQVEKSHRISLNRYLRASEMN